MRLRYVLFPVTLLVCSVYFLISANFADTKREFSEQAQSIMNNSVKQMMKSIKNWEESLEELPEATIKDKIYKSNLQQKILNRETFPNIELVIIVQVHDRVMYLKEMINSLSESQEIQNALVIFSHDVYDTKINEAISEIKFCKVMQIFFPFSLQANPDKFPGQEKNDCPEGATSAEVIELKCKNAFMRDSYKHYRNAAVVQLKLHWWWKLNFAFKQIRALDNYDGNVVLLEEDHYLAPDFIHSLRLMRRHADETCPDCCFFALGHHGRENFYNYAKVITQRGLENVGLTFNRSVFNMLSRHSEDFCGYDDYNWDWTLRYVSQELFEKPGLSMVLSAARLKHIGLCGVHIKNNDCDPSSTIFAYKNAQASGKLFPESFKTEAQMRSYSKTKAFGGFGDPRDYALCLAM